MSAHTEIAWTDHTFNPWTGCTKISPACAHCYAEKSPGSVFRGVKWGPKAERVVSADSTWRQPLAWNRKAKREGINRRVFCGSLCDVFEARDDLDEHRARLWGLIEATPNLCWLLLSKRPENVIDMVPRWWMPDIPSEVGGGWPANVWIGATVEDQRRADERIPYLLRIPAPVRFLSVEPLLGPVDLELHEIDIAMELGPWENVQGRLDWVITGSESGPHRRPTDLAWVRSLRNQCQVARVPFFCKQIPGPRGALRDMDDFPADLRIRQFQEDR